MQVDVELLDLLRANDLGSLHFLNDFLLILYLQLLLHLSDLLMYNLLLLLGLDHLFLCFFNVLLFYSLKQVDRYLYGLHLLPLVLHPDFPLFHCTLNPLLTLALQLARRFRVLVDSIEILHAFD